MSNHEQSKIAHYLQGSSIIEEKLINSIRNKDYLDNEQSKIAHNCSCFSYQMQENINVF